MDRIYFNHNTTTLLAHEAARAMQPFMEGEFGNASSSHWAGQRARDAVERARQQVAGLLHCEAREVVFTSGGTEANNSALAGFFFDHKKTWRPHFFISSVEHPSVANTGEFLERLSASVSRVPVDQFGIVAPAAVALRRAASSICNPLGMARKSSGIPFGCASSNSSAPAAQRPRNPRDSHSLW